MRYKIVKKVIHGVEVEVKVYDPKVDTPTIDALEDWAKDQNILESDNE